MWSLWTSPTTCCKQAKVCSPAGVCEQGSLFLSLIVGLSSFVNVTQLDVSYNCLSDLSCVKKMATLKQLQSLQLAGGRDQ